MTKLYSKEENKKLIVCGHIQTLDKMSEESLSKELKKAIGQLLEQAREDFRNLESNKKERLLRLAQDMEKTGYPIDMISETILKAFAGEEGLSKSTVERILPEKYKRKYEKQSVKMEHLDDKKPIEVSITTNGSRNPAINFEDDEKEEVITGYKQQINRSQEELDRLTPVIQRVRDLEEQLKESRENEKRIKEQFDEQTKNHKEVLAAINNNQNKGILESKEYKAKEAELLLLRNENEQLKQIETERMRKNPSETFQSASAITTITTTIPDLTEIEFPAKELVTLRMDVNAAKPFWNEARNAKKVMYLFITGNQVTGWESDYMREKNKNK